LQEWTPPTQIKIPEEVQRLVDSRREAREQRDWLAADRIRDDLLELGYTVEDAAEGPLVSRITPSISENQD